MWERARCAARPTTAWLSIIEEGACRILLCDVSSFLLLSVKGVERGRSLHDRCFTSQHGTGHSSNQAVRPQRRGEESSPGGVRPDVKHCYTIVLVSFRRYFCFCRILPAAVHKLGCVTMMTA